MEIVNPTPFVARLFAGTDAHGAECAVVIAKATLSIAPGREPQLADEQREVELADVYVGEPGASGLARPSDLCIQKPGTDVALTGRVRPRAGERETEVSLQVGSCAKRVHVSGPRVWERVLGRVRASAPLAFESAPLVWEEAFGGADASARNPKHHGFEEQNPVGRGFRSKRSRLPIDGEALPSLEHPARRMRKPGDRPPPWSFGFVAPAWRPRRDLAGTYDEAWLRSRSPLLPTDFDPGFYDRASTDLVLARAPRPGEPVRVAGAIPSGEYRFPFPELALEASLVFRRSSDPIELHCDTVWIDLDAGELCITWSGHQRIQGRAHDVLGARLRGDVRRVAA